MLVVATGILFSDSLSAGFVYDDRPVVVENARVQQEVLFDDFRKRFLRHVTLVVDHKLFGSDPRGYHAQSLLWHLLCVLGVWALSRRLFKTPLAPLLAAGLFAVHPIHVEAVTGIANRKELLSLAFGLGSMLAYVRSRDPDRRRPLAWVGLALLGWGLALSAKLVAIGLPLCWLAYEAWFVPEPRRLLLRNRAVWLALVWGAVALGVWLQLAYPIDPEGLRQSETFKGYRGELTVFGAQLTGARAFWRYVELLIWPQGLCPDHLVTLSTTLFEWRTALAWLGLAGIVLSVPRLGHSSPVVGFGAVWWLIGFLPVSNLYPISYVLADRYMYAPSVGFALVGVGLGCALHGSLARRSPRGAQIAAWIAALGVGGGYAFVTWTYNEVWADDVSLWTYVQRCEPASYKADNVLGIRRAEAGDPAAALLHYEAAIEKGSPNASFNRGLLLHELGRNQEALLDLARARENLPGRPEVHLEYANVLSAVERFEEAEQSYSRVLELQPDHALAYSNRGAALARQGRLEDARRDYLEAIRLAPDFAEAYYNLGGVLLAQHRIEEARRAFETAAGLGLTAAEAALELLATTQLE